MAVGCDGFLALPAETARWSLPTRRANACVGKVLQAGNSASAVSIQLPMLQLAGVGRKDEEPSSQCADELFRAAVKLYDQVLDSCSSSPYCILAQGHSSSDSFILQVVRLEPDTSERASARRDRLLVIHLPARAMCCLSH